MIKESSELFLRKNTSNIDFEMRNGTKCQSKDCSRSCPERVIGQSERNNKNKRNTFCESIGMCSMYK